MLTPIEKNDIMVVCVDMQEKLFPHIYEKELLLNSIEKAIKCFKIMQVPLLYTEQYSKGLGATIPSLHSMLSWSTKIEKMTFSCCGSGTFLEQLRLLGKNDVILLGVETHVCILQTALDLVRKGLRPIIPYECVGSRNSLDKKLAIERLQQSGAMVTSLESLIFELCVIAGTPEFKKILQVLK